MNHLNSKPYTTTAPVGTLQDLPADVLRIVVDYLIALILFEKLLAVHNRLKKLYYG